MYKKKKKQHPNAGNSRVAIISKKNENKNYILYVACRTFIEPIWLHATQAETSYAH